MKKIAFAFAVFTALLTAGTVADAATYNAYQLNASQTGNGSPSWHDGGR